jgi:hypothetical protein
MTGRETGANARPAITRVASSRRMAKLRFINLESHKMAANERLQPLHGVENSSYCYPLSAAGAVFRRAGTCLRSCRAAVPSSARGLSIELRSSWRFPRVLRKSRPHGRPSCRPA